MLQKLEDLISCKFLGIEHELDAHLLEQQLVLGSKKIIVVNPGRDLFCSEVLCQKGAYDIDILGYERNDRDEQVGVLDIGLPHDGQ